MGRSRKKEQPTTAQAGYQRLFVVEGETEETLLKVAFGLSCYNEDKPRYPSVIDINKKPKGTDIQTSFEKAKQHTQSKKRLLKPIHSNYTEVFIVFDGDVILKDPQHQHKL
ncbi:MAG: hypothetical protein ACKO34_08395, partial [Vampirovibrionales bacterium]